MLIIVFFIAFLSFLFKICVNLRFFAYKSGYHIPHDSNIFIGNWSLTYWFKAKFLHFLQNILNIYFRYKIFQTISDINSISNIFNFDTLYWRNSKWNLFHKKCNHVEENLKTLWFNKKNHFGFNHDFMQNFSERFIDFQHKIHMSSKTLKDLKFYDGFVLYWSK